MAGLRLFTLLTALQHAKLVTSQRIGPWTHYKRHEENMAAVFKELLDMIAAPSPSTHLTGTH